MLAAERHANAGRGNPELLRRFREMNPQLREIESPRYCGNMYPLLTSRHRHSGYCDFGSTIGVSQHCFTDHQESWLDSEAGLEVLVAHSHCPHGRARRPGQEGLSEEHIEKHREAMERFAQRGLAYRVSTGSWYNPGRSTLIVIARADVIQRIGMPEASGEGNGLERIDMEEAAPRIPWREIMEAKLAREAAKREELVQLAPAEEANGDHQAALMFYCDTAAIDREAGFDELAQEQLDHARRLIRMQPWLSTAHVYTANEEDRKHVFGEGLPTVPEGELQEMLDRTDIPEGWEDFRASEWGGHARAEIRGPGGSHWGEAWIEQGGNRNLWAAYVMREDEMTMATIAGRDYGNMTGDESYVLESPEEAVAAAAEIRGRYEELVSREMEKRRRDRAEEG